MKVLLINTFDRGGAANSCKRLHSELLLEGINSKALLKVKQNNWPNSFCLKPTPKLITKRLKIKNKLKQILKEFRLYHPKKSQKTKEQYFLNNRLAELEMFSFPEADYDITQTNLYKEADIINLHWVANFLDYTSFFKKNTKPVVWTLHDMNPFSGGEHYEEKFLGIDNFGFPITRQVSEEETMVVKKNIEIKKRALAKVHNLTIVAPSRWLAVEAGKSDVFKGKPVICIPNGLNAEIYAPRDKNYSRDILNIPRDKKVLLFVSDSLNKNRKGFSLLKKAFEKLEIGNIILCTIGEKRNNSESIPHILELGSIDNNSLMSNAYSAADVFIIPSLMDNLPNTIIESLMCGTPVIGFPVGGIPDMIRDGENGFLTNDISVTSLHETLIKFLNSTNKFDRNKIREKAVEKYDINRQASRYITLFENLMNNKNES